MIFFNNPFKHISLKNVVDLENYGFWSCGFNKIELRFMSVYKTLYMENATWSLLQNYIHNVNK
jgi:hypothetical protein